MTSLAAVPLVRPTRTLADPVRLFHGAGIERADWTGLDRLERRRLVVRARLSTVRVSGVVSHRSAAALWGLPEVDDTDWRLPTRTLNHDTPTGAGAGAERPVSSAACPAPGAQCPVAAARHLPADETPPRR